MHGNDVNEDREVRIRTIYHTHYNASGTELEMIIFRRNELYGGNQEYIMLKYICKREIQEFVRKTAALLE